MFNFYPPVDPAKLRATSGAFRPTPITRPSPCCCRIRSGGLQARNAAGEWIEVPPKPGTFVVNVGNLLERWTNDLYKSTLHRALHVGNAPRISGAFFVYPDADSRALHRHLPGPGKSVALRGCDDGGICPRTAGGCAAFW